MNTKLKLGIMAFTVGTALQVCAQGYIVSNGVYATYPGFMDYEIDVRQNPNDNDFTGFFLKPKNATTLSFSTYLDEGVRVFLVSPNDTLSLQPILANSYPELTFPNDYVFANPSLFYVGLYTGYNPWIIQNGTSVYTGIYTDPVFGWAKLENVGGVIHLLDSALEYGGFGIIVGTQTILVPEPGVLTLSVLGGLLLGWRWRRKRQRLL